MNKDLEKILKGIHRDKPKVIDIPIVEETDASPEEPSPEEEAVVDDPGVTGIIDEDDVDRPYGNVGGGHYDED